MPNRDDAFKTSPMNLLNERTLKGTFFGNYKPRSDIPSVVEKYMNKVNYIQKLKFILVSKILLLFQMLIIFHLKPTFIINTVYNYIYTHTHMFLPHARNS